MNWVKYVPIFFCLLMTFACTKSDPAKRQAMMQAQIDRRVTEFQANIDSRCRKSVLEEAERRVDSILILQSKSIPTVDSIRRPPKPIKPGKPVVPAVADTTPVRPMLEEEKK